MSRREFLGASGAALGLDVASGDLAAQPYRPLIHYSPPVGFMNDPNGLIFHAGQYHLFYQFNPFGSTWGHMHWGHAVSRDLFHWSTLPPALRETAAGMAFSGSAVWDGERMVAIYTRASEKKQVQEIAFSADAGRTFEAYTGNPVLDVGSNAFRDPKVVRYGDRWVMAVAMADERRIVFYGSNDLRRWDELSSFGPAGRAEGQWECPNLVRVPVEGGGSNWVLFVSVSAIAPLGGGGVAYFVGHFDGVRFTADDTTLRFADFGKDFYAMQAFTDSPGAAPLVIAWLCNWQYANETPTGTWRNTMTLVREVRLRRGKNDWRIVQQFGNLAALRARMLGRGRDVPIPRGSAVELQIRMRDGARIRLSNRESEELEIGYDSGQILVDRSGTRGFAHMEYSKRYFMPIESRARGIEARIIFDHCTLEILTDHGALSGSFVHFFRKPPERLSVAGAGSATAFALKPACETCA